MRTGTAFLLCVVAATATAGQRNPTPASRPAVARVVATVHGQDVEVAEEEQIGGAIHHALLEQFAENNDLLPTEEEIDGYARSMRELHRLHILQLKETATRLAAELENSDLSPAERRDRVRELRRTIQSIHPLPEPFATDSANRNEHFAGLRKFQRGLVLDWKVKKALYDRYGGSILVHPFGPTPMPVDAYRAFVNKQIEKGDVEFKDPRYERAFRKFLEFSEYRDVSDEEERDKVMSAPWWELALENTRSRTTHSQTSGEASKEAADTAVQRKGPG